MTFDEDNYDPQNGNRIPTIFCGAKIIAGEYSILINHFNVLHTLESMYGLPFSDDNATTPISGIWAK